MLDLLDILRKGLLADALVLKRGERLTGDIEVENIVIIGRIVYQLPASLIHNQDFPL
jgi:hypothetical protein